jgi:hypothetical protein
MASLPVVKELWMKDAGKVDDRTEKKVYVEPRLEKAQELRDVTEGALPVVTGAVPT